MLQKSAFVYLFITSVMCNTQDLRNPKFISFDATKDDLQVGLDFSLPFLQIPIKTAASDTDIPYGHHDLTLPKINVNLSSLLVGGLVFLVTTFISPLLNKSYTTHHRASRDNTPEEYNPLLKFSNEILSKNTGCLQRIACLSSQQTQDVKSLRTMKRIIRNDLLASILNTTALEEAVNDGVKGKDCHSYVPCILTKEDFISVVDTFFSVHGKPHAV